jgi:hypothetical protein
MSTTAALDASFLGGFFALLRPCLRCRATRPVPLEVFESPWVRGWTIRCQVCGAEANGYASLADARVLPPATAAARAWNDLNTPEEWSLP